MKLSIKQIENMTKHEAEDRGMASWDGKLYLIPLSDWHNWPKGCKVTSILGDICIKGKDYIDEDTRGGFLAFGIYPK